MCYKDRLACYDTNTIKNIIENLIKTEKYMEKKNGKTISKWDKKLKTYTRIMTVSLIMQSPLFNFYT
jgi:hypothetical protein